MKWSARKHCEECGRVFDGDACPECGKFATEYANPEDDSKYDNYTFYSEENNENQEEEEDDFGDDEEADC